MTNKKYSEYYADQSPIPFYVLLSLFILSNMLRVVNFTPEVKVIIDDVRVWINAAVIIMGRCILLLLYYYGRNLRGRFLSAPDLY